MNMRLQVAVLLGLAMVASVATPVAADTTKTVVPLKLRVLQKDKQSLITIDSDEAYRLINVDGWHESTAAEYAFKLPVEGSVPIYRYYKPSINDHLFTTDKAEGEQAMRMLSYQSEGVCCYLMSAQDQVIDGTRYKLSGVYRFLADDKVHFYAPGNASGALTGFGLKAPGTLKLEAMFGYQATSNLRGQLKSAEPRIGR